jgi:1-acyl-sn-glycerol-3-phosphate acyltransferase
MLIIGIPAILTGMIFRSLLGIENTIFPPARFAVRIYLWAAGVRVSISGLERLDPRQTYVFVANHQSNLDPPILFCHLPHYLGGIAKQELEKIPFFRQGFALAHIVPIDRRNRESALRSTRRGAEELRRGNSLMAFPEGTRSPDGRLREFKKGVFYMAIEAGVPVVPIVFNGTRQVMPKVGGVVRPGPVSVEVLSPIETGAYTSDTVAQLVAQVRGLIEPRVVVDPS